MNAASIYETAKPHTTGGYRDIEPARVASVMGMRIIDVREPAEYDGELGHVPQAELVPLGVLEQFARRWALDEEIVVVCRSGARSARAAALLASMGFRRVMNMTGGMLAWTAVHLPVEKRNSPLTND